MFVMHANTVTRYHYYDEHFLDEKAKDDEKEDRNKLMV